MKKIFLLFLGMLVLSQATTAQTIINAYAQVSSISGTTINLSNVDETNGTFAQDGYIFIMQMQDNVIGSNTSDNSNFGNLGSINNAGHYDGLTIATVSRSSGTLTSITVTDATWLSNYNIGANTSVQIISVPKLGGGSDYTTSSDLTCKAWDGNTGGVLAFTVNGVLNLQNDINVDGKGFRGGEADRGNSTSCSDNVYRIATSSDNYADKGEGIYKNTSVDYVSGRGHILSGGGGGNSHNAGGAGGGNGSVGGSGGFGWQCNPSAGGIGGLDLSSYTSAAQIFMGGGGGSGEGNNNKATPGANGGGIILIRANSISTSSSCSGVSITANGAAAADCNGNDGSGGGGAGGSIVLNVGSYSIDANCPLSVKASGGNGGSVLDGAEHGGGGGGGMGAIIYSSTTPTTNVTNETDPGTGGSSGGSNNNPGDSGSGTVGGEEGVGENDNTGPLPVSLLYFELKSENDIVKLNWVTASETNNMGFDIEKSNNGEIWNRVDFVQGNGNSNEIIKYSFVDNQPYSGVSYYRLKQMDFDGKFDYSKVLSINTIKTMNQYFRIAPNPTKGMIYFKHNFDEDYKLSIYSIDGRLMFSKEMGAEELNMDINSLPLGVYIIEIQNRTSVIKKKIILE